MPNTRLLHLQSPQADKRDRGVAAHPRRVQNSAFVPIMMHVVAWTEPELSPATLIEVNRLQNGCLPGAPYQVRLNWGREHSGYSYRRGRLVPRYREAKCRGACG